MDSVNAQPPLSNGQGHIKFGHDERIMKNGNGSNSNSPSTVSHIPYEKSKMIDITRDKPIKITVRVAVPVRDHPKFNFVGKLLGPKGNSLKRLQEETMCKMSVLGRGSMRDRKKEEELRLSGEHKYSHLSEDLHVEIQTFAPPAEGHARIAYALAEVRRFLVPDHHDDIRQEQKWEMQALSTQNNGGSSSSSNSSSDETHEQSLGCDSLACETGSSIAEYTTAISPSSSSSCGNHSVENCIVSRNFNNNTSSTATVAINNNNNNNCDMIKNNNNNNQMHVTTTPIEIDNEVEPAAVLIDQQNALLRGVNIAPTPTIMGRKRPLLCNAINNISNPTKRTVLTLLARAKTANALHGFHPNGPSITNNLQLLASPLIIPQTLEHVLQTTTNTIPATLQPTAPSSNNPQSIKQENLLQGA